MSDDRKRAGSGAMVVPTPSDDRKHSSASSASAKKVIIKSADMKEELQREAVDIAIAVFDKHNVEKDVAEAIKKEFDRKHGPTWHCIVGKNFVGTSLWKSTLLPPLMPPSMQLFHTRPGLPSSTPSESSGNSKKIFEVFGVLHETRGTC